MDPNLSKVSYNLHLSRVFWEFARCHKPQAEFYCEHDYERDGDSDSDSDGM